MFLNKSVVERLYKWKVRSGFFPVGNMTQLMRQLKKINDERLKVLAKQRRTDICLSKLNQRLKVLYSKQNNLVLEIGKRKGSRCPCLKHKIRKSTYSWQSDHVQTLCLARKNTWTGPYIVNDRSFFKTYCGPCSKTSAFKVNKALLRQIEGEWKKVES